MYWRTHLLIWIAVNLGARRCSKEYNYEIEPLYNVLLENLSHEPHSQVTKLLRIDPDIGYCFKNSRRLEDFLNDPAFEDLAGELILDEKLERTMKQILRLTNQDAFQESLPLWAESNDPTSQMVLKDRAVALGFQARLLSKVSVFERAGQLSRLRALAFFDSYEPVFRSELERIAVLAQHPDYADLGIDLNRAKYSRSDTLQGWVIAPLLLNL